MKVLRFQIYQILCLKRRQPMNLPKKYRLFKNSLKRLSRQQLFTVLIIFLIMFLYSLSSSTESHNENVLSKETPTTFQKVLSCSDKDFEPRKEIYGTFWLLKNYVRADHGLIHCHETVTFATHATVGYLHHLQTLVERWKAPISLTIHAPGSDFGLAIDSISYLRNCMHNNLIKKHVTFHIFFSFQYMPHKFRNSEPSSNKTVDCSKKPPYLIDFSETFMSKKNFLYPINVARNIARDAALTHFILSLDIDTYPSPNLVSRFLSKIWRNGWQQSKFITAVPRVFTIAMFEMKNNGDLPSTKAELEDMLSNNSAVYLQNIPNCTTCFNVPVSTVTQPLHAKNIISMDNIENYFRARNGKPFWDPIFIGTQADPRFDERLSWEGQYDKFPLAYVMCVKKYHISELKDEFLVQRRDEKPFPRKLSRDIFINQQADYVNSQIIPNLKKIFGTVPGCSLN